MKTKETFLRVLCGESPLLRDLGVLRGENPPDRRGAALLVVIGLLALLLISTMAFSVLMSIERSAASNYRHSVQARQMLYAGLAQAIADIDNNVVDLPYPPWTNNPNYFTASRTNLVRYAEVLQSIDPNSLANSNICPAKVLSQAALKYIPKSLLQAVQTVPTEYLQFTVNGTTNIVGRYAYLAVNVSGLLDANTVATTNRWLGLSSGEIQANPGVLFDVTNAVAFTNERATIDQRYESLAELAQLNTGIDSNKVSNFETFSYAPESCLAGDSTSTTKKYKLYIGGDLQSNLNSSAEYYPGTGQTFSNRLREVLSQPDVLGYNYYYYNTTPALQAAEISSRVDAFISTMLDAVYPGIVPRRLDAPAITTTPFLYEVSWQPTITWNKTLNGGKGVFIFAHTITVWAYTPITADANTYSVSAVITATHLPTMTAPPSCIAALATALNGANCTATITPVSRSGQVIQFGTFTLPTVNGNCPTAAWALPAGQTFAFNGTTAFGVSIQLTLSNATTGVVVDQVPVPWGVPLNGIPFDTLFPGSFRGQPANNSPQQFNQFAWYSEAFDPRCNWQGAPQYLQWVRSDNQSSYLFSGIPLYQGQCWNAASFALTSPASLFGTTNWQGHLFDGVGMRSDGTYWHDNSTQQRQTFCPGRAFRDVGELANLLVDSWQTPRLYDHNDAASLFQNDSNALPTLGNLPTFYTGGITNHFSRFYHYFTMTPPPSSAGSDVIIRRGLVNINTRNTNVLASAFLNMPLRDWDPTYATDGLGLGTLNANQAYVAAQNLQNFMQSNLPNGLATNTDALTMTPWNSATMMSSMSLTNEMDRKAFVRNAMSLFTARQQIYTIIVRADAMSYEYGGVVQGSGNSNNPLNNGTVLGSAQAVFQVWRDPVGVDASGNPVPTGGFHHCFVRLCKILSL